MLKAKDLRIGNVIDYDGMECIVQEIDEQGVVVYIHETQENEWIDLFQFTPCYLDDEWLERLGYNKIVDHYHLKLHCIWKCNDMFICEKNGTILKYVHELQNLLYSIKGIEFKI